MDNKITELVNLGWNVRFWSHRIRLDRKWNVNVNWEAEYKDKKYGCDWKGFDNAELCLINFISSANEIMNQNKI
jgi:hypothetical protein